MSNDRGPTNLDRYSTAIERYLTGHRLASFLVGVVAMVLVAGSVLMGDYGDGPSLVRWIAFGLMVYAPIALVLVYRLAQTRSRPLIAWGISVSPFVAGVAAVTAGSSAVIMWVATAESTCLLAWVALTMAEPRVQED